jgi:flagellar P-ring protein precursor FlgI
VAAVAVHADLPAFAKPGQTIDITVSSVGEAASLQGGTLLQTFLRGVDGKVYAVAQGSLVVSGFGAQGGDGSRIVVNTPTVGRIPNGAMVEQSVPTGFANGDTLTLNLHYPDFSTAKSLADTINERLGAQPENGYVIAKPIDAASVRVSAPRDVGQRVAITHGGLTVTISENQQVSQPNAFGEGQTAVTTQSIVDVDLADSRMFKFEPGVTLDQLVRAVNEVGAAPGDLMAILEALRQAGALRGELVII